jgi:hypothetical protein
MYMHKNTLIAIGAFFLGSIGLASWFALSDMQKKVDTPTPSVSDPVTSPTSLLRTYTNSTYGISFSYPTEYIVTEAEQMGINSGYYSITLVHQNDTAPRENSEGPTYIGIDIFLEDDVAESLRDWLKRTPESNFSLSNGSVTEGILAGAPSLTYHWSGLYEADTTLVRDGNNMILATVTYISRDEPIVETYTTIINSLRF